MASTSAATPAASTLAEPKSARTSAARPGASTPVANTPAKAKLDGSSPLQQAGPSASERQSPYAQKAGSEHGKLADKPIRDLLESKSITLPDYSPGQKRAQCPMCAGGSTHEESLALHISNDSQSAKWICHRATCGWEGGINQASGCPSPSLACICLHVVIDWITTETQSFASGLSGHAYTLHFLAHEQMLHTHCLASSASASDCIYLFSKWCT